jgi:hypothetical protein
VHLRFLFSAVTILGFAHAQESATEAVQARKAVERGLPLLEKEGVVWMKEKGCASCHHVPFLLWSHNEAPARGIAVDAQKLADWTDWSWKFSQTRRAWFKLTKEALKDGPEGALPADVRVRLKGVLDTPFATEQELLAALKAALTQDQLGQHEAALVKRATRLREPENDGGGLDTLCQLLLGRAKDTKDGRAFTADIRDQILRWQEPDGSWKAAGQLPLQARPAAETDSVTTMWAILALASLDDSDPSTLRSIMRAMTVLGDVKPGQSNESLVVSLLVQRRLGEAEKAKGLLAEILSRQNTDGGWAWKQGAESDAFATGQALYALCRSGLSGADPAVRRARRYLILTQQEDGSWLVPARAISPSQDPTRLSKLAPIYRYWGTAWATIGLAGSLPVPRRTGRRY